MESSTDSSNSSQNNNIYNEVYEDFRRQALHFYGNKYENDLSPDVEKCLKKKANAFVNRNEKKLFLFPCMNDLSNIPDDDEDCGIPQKCLDSMLSGKLKSISDSRRSSDIDATSSQIQSFSSLIIKSSNLSLKNQDSL